MFSPPRPSSPTPARASARYSSRPFLLTLLIFTLLVVAVQLCGHAPLGSSSTLDAPPPLPRASGSEAGPLDCKSVHRATDQCAFIQANCADEEAGLISYLSLYYCRLGHTRALAMMMLVLWLAVLFMTIGIAASDFFCVNLSTMASVFGMSESVAGVTLLALGNGSPDVFSTFAAMSSDSGGLAVGELIGAASFISTVVVGAMAVTQPFRVARKSFVRDVSFFVVATAFSLAILADGRLHLWECVVMVAFYLGYVVTVVVWHWWYARRLRRRRVAVEEELAASPPVPDLATRHSDLAPEPEEDAAQADGSDGHGLAPPRAGERTALLPRRTSSGLSALGYGGAAIGRSPSDEGESEDEDDEEAQERWLAQVNNVMRVSHRPRHDRRSVANPIRPSLIGALEFRAALSSLQRSPTLRPAASNLRRHTDHASLALASNFRRHSFTSEPSAASVAGTSPAEARLRPGRGLSLDPSREVRARTVSVNDSSQLGLGHDALALAASGAGPLLAAASTEHAAASDDRGLRGTSPPPRVSVTPPTASIKSREPSPGPQAQRLSSSDMLLPPGPAMADGARALIPEETRRRRSSAAGAAKAVRMTPQQLPRIVLPQSPAASPPHSPTAILRRLSGFPFPQYSESPLPWSAHEQGSSSQFPSRTASIYASSPDDDDGAGLDEAEFSWWPARYLPASRALRLALFPTLSGWRSKSAWERGLALAAAPTVFLLTVTLPVVELGSDEDEDGEGGEGRGGAAVAPTVRAGTLPAESAMADGTTGPSDATASSSSPPAPAKYGETNGGADGRHLPATAASTGSGGLGRDWNRWLVATQLVLAPAFVVAVVWANTAAEVADGESLLRPVAVAGSVSVVACATLMLTTRADRAPRWRFLLCFVGFVVSVAWISTVAGEVVGLLKALGVILGISDAILGLTVFAVGNSLGDLVADITVARLGFPVMALSACFGGPLLNILLGIGLSGGWMTIRDGSRRHDKHPHKRVRYRPYELQASPTLMISGGTLLLTLAGLLVVVPWNQWRMDRKIGWGLIMLWIVSTIGSLFVEISGSWGDG